VDTITTVRERASAELSQSSIDSSTFESVTFPDDDVLEREPSARIHWLRPEGHGSQVAGVYRRDPAVFRYTWEAGETIHMLEGSVRIDLDDRDNFELSIGDDASFSADDRGVWHVLVPFCGLFVLSA
jgi:uncharacterized cupin superfamily protein